MFGWEENYIDKNGYPSPLKQPWVADCFVIFGYIIFVAKVREA